MHKKITSAAITFILLASFFISAAQSGNERYHYVTLRGIDVKNTIDNFPGFAYFDFTFTPVGNNTYSLSGYAKDQDSNTIGNLITLIPITTHPTKPLKNMEKGHLYLTLDIMHDNNVDGSEDYVLSPRKTKDKSGHQVDYVSYRFNNKPDDTSTDFIAAYAVRAFNLNPSPPY